MFACDVSAPDQGHHFRSPSLSSLSLPYCLLSLPSHVDSLHRALEGQLVLSVPALVEDCGDGHLLDGGGGGGGREEEKGGLQHRLAPLSAAHCPAAGRPEKASARPSLNPALTFRGQSPLTSPWRGTTVRSDPPACNNSKYFSPLLYRCRHLSASIYSTAAVGLTLQ